jgi:hypothetical protein
VQSTAPVYRLVAELRLLSGGVLRRQAGDLLLRQWIRAGLNQDKNRTILCQLKLMARGRWLCATRAHFLFDSCLN